MRDRLLLYLFVCVVVCFEREGGREGLKAVGCVLNRRAMVNPLSRPKIVKKRTKWFLRHASDTLMRLGTQKTWRKPHGEYLLLLLLLLSNSFLTISPPFYFESRLFEEPYAA